MAMVFQQAVAVVARTSAHLALFAAVICAGQAAAQERTAEPPEPSAEYVLGDNKGEGLGLVAFGFRFAYLIQRGLGFQSKAGEPGEPGDEEMTLVQPTGYVDIRQNEKTLHQVNFAVDLVTSASADALDAVSAASRVNEAGAIDITTVYEQNETATWRIRYGVHWEEPLVAIWTGLGLDLSFAENNFVLSTNVLANIDLFDEVTPTGRDEGVTSRSTFNGNISATQILSPTTVASLSYGLTYQYGTLAQTWNSVQLEGSEIRLGERFRQSRMRHAVGGRISQMIPATHTSVHAGYRFYIDDYELRAHSANTSVYQYLTPHFYLRGDYRFHTQTSVDFYANSLPLTFDRLAPRTADSDLSAFTAHEFGGKFVYLFNPRGSSLSNNEFFDLSYLHYRRSNGMRIHTVSLGYGGRF